MFPPDHRRPSESLRLTTHPRPDPLPSAPDRAWADAELAGGLIAFAILFVVLAALLAASLALIDALAFVALAAACGAGALRRLRRAA